MIDPICTIIDLQSTLELEGKNMENATIYEVLQFAINMEEEGIKFYEKWASKSKGNIKETLKRLAADEMVHASYFKCLYDGLKEKPEVDYLFEEEVIVYFKTYAGSAAAFNRKQVNLDSVWDVIEEGMLTEKNSIDYYQSLLKYSKENIKEMLEKIIKEEEIHLHNLEELLTEA
jgi:rubrerythrin